MVEMANALDVAKDYFLKLSSSNIQAGLAAGSNDPYKLGEGAVCIADANLWIIGTWSAENNKLLPSNSLAARQEGGVCQKDQKGATYGQRVAQMFLILLSLNILLDIGMLLATCKKLRLLLAASADVEALG